MKLATEALGDWEYPNGLRGTDIDGRGFYGKIGAEDKVLFFGDSHVAQYGPRIVKLLNEDPVNTKTAVFATRLGCPPIPNVYEDKHPRCTRDFRENVIDYALSADVDSVVIGASWDYFIPGREVGGKQYRYYYLKGDKKHYFDRDGIEYAYGELEKLLASIAQLKTVYLILDNPSGKNFDPKSFFTGTRLSGIVDRQVVWQQYDFQQNVVRERLKKIGRAARVTVIDPVEHLCRDNRCRTSLDNGVPIYKDSSHIRPFYVKEYIDYMDVTVRH